MASGRLQIDYFMIYGSNHFAVNNNVRSTSTKIRMRMRTKNTSRVLRKMEGGDPATTDHVFRIIAVCV